MRKKLMLGGLGLVLAVGMLTSPLSWTAPTPRRAELQVFMRQKLGWSQGVLEGLTLERYALVSSNALRMRNMTQSNYWTAFQYPDYLVLTTNFQKNANALVVAAADRNLEAATDAYLKTMKNCVECHRLFRLEQSKQAGQVKPAK